MTTGSQRTTPSETLVLRPLKVVVFAWVGAVAIVGLFTAIALVLRNSPTGVVFRPADQVAMVLLGVFMAGGVLLMARPRIRADAEGIEVRNVLATRRLSWDQVERVSFPDSASWARLDLPDYEYIPLMAVQAVDGARAVKAMRRLRALHAAARDR
ncbi:MAG: PH domain-containing protein [Pseudonocardia sp.]|nr:PH domain-containing protein [Pseudonocardia sp.]